jgi:hypothetical protein
MIELIGMRAKCAAYHLSSCCFLVHPLWPTTLKSCWAIGNLSLFSPKIFKQNSALIRTESTRTGFIGFTPGRFFAFVTAESRNAPQTSEEQAAASYRTVIAYTGNWRLDGEKFITKVDVAWNPGWVGTDQVRF